MSELSHTLNGTPTTPHANLQASERLKGLRVSFAASKKTLISRGIKRFASRNGYGNKPTHTL